ncbi:MAG: phage shock protein E [Bacteroidia bacterium]|jgi:phage shock protein E
MFGIFKNLFKTKQDLSAVVAQGAIILDVRSVGEYKSGHGASAKNIPLDQIQNKRDH